MTNPIIENRDDLGMLKRPDLWPNWGVLPLKNRRDERLGYVFASDSTTVIIGLIFGDLRDPARERVHYADHEAVIDAGWVVD
jgi:hypothetical protein